MATGIGGSEPADEDAATLAEKMLSEHEGKQAVVDARV